MDNVLLLVNQNKIVWGVSMLMLQFGARYVIGDLGKAHEMILSNEISKKLVVLAMFFVATRDVAVSFILTIAYIVIVDGILHEKRKFCLLPRNITEKINNSKTTISTNDFQKAQEIIKQYQEQQNPKDIPTSETSIKDNLSYLNYLTNITLLQKL
jgi:hypothetical protein